MLLPYTGTRNTAYTAEASEAILRGICPDGGLYAPREIPRMQTPLSELLDMDYQELAYAVMRLFFTDFTEEELRDCIRKAYDEKFDTPVIAPLVAAGDALVLELFHGKTLAFKDMALSILPHLMKTAAKKQGQEKEIVILTATSGDTGKAALEGFADVPGTRILVFFPEDGVSPVQKLQMTTQTGENTAVVGIHGNFDDAQSAVKAIFTDEALQKELEEAGMVFSSANSINIGRLVPQVVYYFYAYLQAVRQGVLSLGDSLSFTVPTGNFGNILAGYYAYRMGLPVGKLVCASNDNKVLYDFFSTGAYDKNRVFHVTMSPSMDILISSNLERLLYEMGGPEKTAQQMEALQKTGQYKTEITEPKLSGAFATEAETRAAIQTLYQKNGYVMDPHTAVAYHACESYRKETGDTTPMVLVSTASPYKFAKDVLVAIDETYAGIDPLEALKKLEELSGIPIPSSIAGIGQKEIRHTAVCEKDGIRAFVRKALLD